MDVPEVVEEFYGVYLLYCLNERYLGRTYIGYTVDPNRRISQHNKGAWAGGARRTSNRGPWKMVMIIHGFPNNIAALRFEWAWQNPERSRRLIHVPHRTKRPREKQLQFRLRILAEMLSVGPWKRLPLIVRWLAEEFSADFPPDKLPPFHIPICHGPVKSKKVSRTQEHISNSQKNGLVSTVSNEQAKSLSPKKHYACISGKEAGKNLNSKQVNTGTPPSSSSNSIDSKKEARKQNSRLNAEEMIHCSLCVKIIDSPTRMLTCLNQKCDLVTHLHCLSELFLESGEYVPIEGDCPFCSQRLLWGNLIRKMKGCQDVQWIEEDDDKEDNDFASSGHETEENLMDKLSSSVHSDESVVLYLSDCD